MNRLQQAGYLQVVEPQAVQAQRPSIDRADNASANAFDDPVVRQEARQAMDTEPTTPRHLVVTVHGIRTLKDWGRQLESSYNSRHKPVEFHHFDFGFFDFVSFVLPPARSIIVQRLVAMLKIIRTSSDDRVDIVAHSFGTYVVANALRQLTVDEFKAHTVIFCGSVLPREFRWEQLIEKRVVSRLVNDCALNDRALVATQFLVLGTGIGGMLGFYGLNSSRFTNRFFSHGHSGFFEEEGTAAESSDKACRMLERWGTLIRGNENDGIEVIDERDKKPSLLTRIKWTMLNNFTPVKLLMYCAPVIAILLYGWNLQLRTEASEARAQASELRSRALETHNLTESGSMLALVDQISGDDSSAHVAKKLLIVQILGQLVSTHSEFAWQAARDNWAAFERDLKLDPEPGDSYWFRERFFEQKHDGRTHQALIDDLTHDWQSSQRNRANLLPIARYLSRFIDIDSETVKSRWYEQAMASTAQIASAATAQHPFDRVRAYNKLFWRLYLGELPLVESDEVASRMVAFGAALEVWEKADGTATPALAAALRTACEQLHDTVVREIQTLARQPDCSAEAIVKS